MKAKNAPRATRREWIGLAVLMLPTLLIAMDMTVLHLAVPALTADLKPDTSQLLWITDIYGFMIAGMLVTMGTLGDRIGRRKLLMAGAVGFGIASVIAAFSTTPNMLIAARALLGIAGATLMPSTMSLIRNMFLDPRQRTVAIGIWVSGFSVGGAVGPLVGGALLEYFSWHSVFLIAVPFLLVLLVAGWFLLPEYKDPHPGRFDLPSAFLSLAAVLPVIYGLKNFAQEGPGVVPLVTVAAGLIFGGIFIQRQRTLADPLIDLNLFRIPAFITALATYTLGIFAGLGTGLFIAQYLQLVLGLSPLEAGMWSVPGSIAFVLGSNTAPRLVRHIRPAYIVVAGLLTAAAGFALITQVGVDSLANIVIGNILMSIGFGFAFTLTVDMVIAAAPPERAGAASAIAETGAEFGGALGLAILGSLGMAIYRSQVAGALPAGLSPEVVKAAEETIGGAVAAVANLPAATGEAVLNAARPAFAHALQVNAAIGVIGFLILAGLTITMLRDIMPHTEEGEEDETELDIPAGLPTFRQPEPSGD